MKAKAWLSCSLAVVLLGCGGSPADHAGSLQFPLSPAAPPAPTPNPPTQGTVHTGAGCPSGFGTCPGDTVACHTNLYYGDAKNCGACGVVCSANHIATPRCGGSNTNPGVCNGACDAGFADCNGNKQTDGCETGLTDVNNCGACGNVCSKPAHAKAGCTGGTCGIGSCDNNWADCNHQAADGCEKQTDKDPANCGACGQVCGPIAHGQPGCDKSACQATCDVGFDDCNKVYADGCEINSDTDESNCGSCAKVCPAGQTCTEGKCTTLVCPPGFADCNAKTSDGCEVNVNTDPKNCGSCGNKCNLAHATDTCVGGTCGIVTCDAKNADCNHVTADGCEVNTDNDLANCGACGVACTSPIANATAKCEKSACTAKCTAGFDNCDAVYANGCEINIDTDPRNCGACGNACAVGRTCTAGNCGLTCLPGLGDCNGIVADGCETNVNTDPNNCGACGSKCSLPSATAGCSGGQCFIASCNAKRGDCNHVASDGCEINTDNDEANCGACGAVCGAIANGTPNCAKSACAAKCTAGFGDCDAVYANGCEINLNTDKNNCAKCGTKCAAGKNCTAGKCV